MIEYLLTVQNYLDTENKRIIRELQDGTKKNEVFKSQYQKQEEEIQTLRKENRKLKKTVNLYDLLLKLPQNPANSHSFVILEFFVI